MLISEMKYVGVDGCVGGWLGVGLDNGEGHEVKGFMEFADLVTYSQTPASFSWTCQSV